MDQFVLLHQDDNNLYIKILSSVYITPYCGLNKDDHRYTFTLGDKKFFGCLTTDYESFTQSSIYPYIVTITFQYYTYVQDDDKLTKLQVYEWITKQVQTQVDYQVEQKINQLSDDRLQHIEQVAQQKVQDAVEQQIDLEQLQQFKQLQEKVDLLQQRVIDITRKVKRYIRL